MKVLLAGASGAIGRPLTRALVEAGHEVLALARSRRAPEPGVTWVAADVMDRGALLRAVEGHTADAVIHELTALRRPKLRLTADDPSTALRVTGTAHLLEAAQSLGAKRFMTQSLVTGYGYLDHGERMLTEDDPFGVATGGPADIVVQGLLSTEEQACRAGGIALRYGVFYGPGTWVDPTPGTRSIPVPSQSGVMSWIHVEDAALATVAALERGRGGHAYNIVDDTPARWGDVVETAARARGSRVMRLPGWLLRLAVPYLGALMIDTSIRVSNAKAGRDLGFSPTRSTLEVR